MLMTISQERKRKCWNQVLLVMTFMLLFVGFFIYTYFFHLSELKTLYLIQQHSPPFFKRFETISLQYQFIREKIINQNTNDTQMDFHLPKTATRTKTADGKPIPIGQYYHDEGMEGENEIQNQKNSNPAYLGPLLKFVRKLDSGQFCDVVFNLN